MTLLELLTNVDRSPSNEIGWLDERDVLSPLNHDYLTYIDCSMLNRRLKGYWLVCRMCTDTHVGLAALYLDTTLVGVYQQDARKSDVRIEFISEEAALLVLAYVKECCDIPEQKFVISTDLDEQQSEFACFEFAGDIIDRNGFYNGKPVKFVGTSQNGIYPSKNILVEMEHGSVVTIPAIEYKIPMRLAK